MPDKRPLLSIIVPVYNTSERLEACLESLLAQTAADLELILVDDGSTDRSADICRAFQSRDPGRVRFFSGPNRGVSAARNRGLDAAAGEWIAFCDSDDRADPELYRVLHANAVARNAELSCCAIRRIAPDGERILTDFPFRGESAVMERGEIIERFFLPLLCGRPECNGFLVCCLFRRDLVEKRKIRFVENLSMKEDELFLLEYLLLVRRLTATERPLYDYLRFEASLCATYYKAGSDLDRERNWVLRARKQRPGGAISGAGRGIPAAGVLSCGAVRLLRPLLRRGGAPGAAETSGGAGAPGRWRRRFRHGRALLVFPAALSAAPAAVVPCKTEEGRVRPETPPERGKGAVTCRIQSRKQRWETQ